MSSEFNKLDADPIDPGHGQAGQAISSPTMTDLPTGLIPERFTKDAEPAEMLRMIEESRRRIRANLEKLKGWQESCALGFPRKVISRQPAPACQKPRQMR